MNPIPQQINIPLEFTPPDFFYLSPTSGYNPVQCSAFSISPENIPVCGADSSDDEYQQCYQYELCRNQEMANILYQKRDKHYGAEQKYTDFELQYKFSYITTINLCMGIIAGIAYIHYVR